MRTEVPRQVLVEDVRRTGEECGGIPSTRAYREKGRFSVNTMKRRFGSWNKMLMEVFGEVFRLRDIRRVRIRCGNNKCARMLLVKETEQKDRFCCVACANVAKPRRIKKVVRCRGCGKDVGVGRRGVWCRACVEKRSVVRRTIGEFCGEDSDANRYCRIREHARKVAACLPDKCVACGYDRHVQVCHRKAIKSFTKDALVGEVNALSNLVKLCRNHHWELDNGLLKI